MQLSLKHCTELELISYKILLLHQINDSRDVLIKVEKAITKIQKIKLTPQKSGVFCFYSKNFIIFVLCGQLKKLKENILDLRSSNMKDPK